MFLVKKGRVFEYPEPVYDEPRSERFMNFAADEAASKLQKTLSIQRSWRCRLPMASDSRIATHCRLALTLSLDLLRLSLVVVRDSELDSDSDADRDRDRDSARCSDPSKLRLV